MICSFQILSKPGAVRGWILNHVLPTSDFKQLRCTNSSVLAKDSSMLKMQCMSPSVSICMLCNDPTPKTVKVSFETFPKVSSWTPCLPLMQKISYVAHNTVTVVEIPLTFVRRDIRRIAVNFW